MCDKDAIFNLHNTLIELREVVRIYGGPFVVQAVV